MSLRLRLAALWLPRVVRERFFLELAERTARAFESSAPNLSGLSGEPARLAFARFTQEKAAGLQADPPARARAEARLREESVSFGRRLGSVLGVRTRADVLRAARLLYRSIRIDFAASASGGIRMTACSFAETYSPATCRTIAALDEGLLVGLAGGGRLAFTSRLTEGAEACRAQFDFPESLP
ncbi:MAG: hypothetical protein NTZ26_10395 [Candidatus Aminicenantes bacterium]|nr:hypothetical protein [Candidatus Aminicenantes bacterium]